MQNISKKGGAREGSGRKPTGLTRNKPFTIRATEEEIKQIKASLSKYGKTQTDAVLNLIKMAEEK